MAVRSTGLNEQWLFVQHGCQAMFVKPIVQPAVSCKRGFRLLNTFTYFLTAILSCLQTAPDVRNKSRAKVLIHIILRFLLLRDGWQYCFNVIFVITI